MIERDVAHDDFGDLDFSADLQGSPLMTELDPAVWFTMHRDENELQYAVWQLAADYKDLDAAIGDADPAQAVSDVATAGKVKREVLDVLYDLDLLRDRSRRVFARACWFVSQGRDFVSLHPLEAIRQRYKSHQEWIEQARLLISPYSVGGENCFAMLSFKEPERRRHRLRSRGARRCRRKTAGPKCSASARRSRQAMPGSRRRWERDGELHPAFGRRLQP